MKKNRNNGGKSCWMIFSLGTIFSFLFESWKLIEKKSHWKCGCNVLLSFGFAKKSYQKLQKDPREIFWYDEAAAAGVNQKNGEIVENIFCYFVQKSPGGKKSWLATSSRLSKSKCFWWNLFFLLQTCFCVKGTASVRLERFWFEVNRSWITHWRHQTQWRHNSQHNQKLEQYFCQTVESFEILKKTFVEENVLFICDLSFALNSPRGGTSLSPSSSF